MSARKMHKYSAEQLPTEGTPVREDLRPDQIFVMPGSAKNEYRILEVNNEVVKLLKLKDNTESVLSKESLLNIMRLEPARLFARRSDFL
jgi:hypothetical protein